MSAHQTVAGLVLALVAMGVARGQAGPKREVAVKRNVRIAMRDGGTLGADIDRPEAPGRFPALMLLRYYQTGDADARFFAQHGYVCVLVDSRGRGKSEGQWDPYVNEPRDGRAAPRRCGAEHRTMCSPP